jgi:hypothetical protein
MNSLATDSPAMTAYSTIGTLGGITTPIVPAEAMSAAEKSTSYFFSLRSGSRAEPTAAVVAAPDPEMAAMNIDASTETMESPPRRLPSPASANDTMRSEMPPLASMSPASIKNGTATRENELLPSSRVCGTSCNGMPLEMNTMSDDSPIASPIGTPMIISAKNEPKIIHPIMVVLLPRSSRCRRSGVAP